MNDDFFFINKNNVSEMCHLSTNICQLTPLGTPPLTAPLSAFALI